MFVTFREIEVPENCPLQESGDVGDMFTHFFVLGGKKNPHVLAFEKKEA
jgi:hypothetical protein